MKVYVVNQTATRTAFAILFVLFLSFGQVASALDIADSKYPFPTKDPYMATILSSFSPTKAKYDEWTMVYRPERMNAGYPLQKPEVKLQTYKQKGQAPLVLIIAGLGGNGYSTNSVALGDEYIKAGFHVITLPNNLSWSYTQGISETGVPGYLPRDKTEYYQFIKWVLDYAKNKKGMNYSSITLVGYSNGGVLAGFLAPLDKKQSQPIFKKVLLINPGVDVIYGIQKLDYLNDVVGAGISQPWKDHIYGAIYTHAGDITAAKDPVKALFNMIDELKIQPNHIQWVIGNQYRTDLQFIIVSSHFVKHRVLTTPYSKYKLNALEDEALSYNFMAYLQKFVIPSLPPELQHSNIIYDSSLYSQMEDLKNDARVSVFTNADDFLLKPTDLTLLRENFGDRLVIYPYGGHMGNIVVPFNVQMYMKFSQ
ncbi:hypothetical protein CIK05_05725 [Bdellovibrio sp. qaytius]|nr:hypothetical protein CIK05_05725 [Bdellovibrio sp. qaytius]